MQISIFALLKAVQKIEICISLVGSCAISA